MTATGEVEKMIGLVSPEEESNLPAVPSPSENDRALAELQKQMGGIR